MPSPGGNGGIGVGYFTQSRTCDLHLLVLPFRRANPISSTQSLSYLLFALQSPSLDHNALVLLRDFLPFWRGNQLASSRRVLVFSGGFEICGGPACPRMQSVRRQFEDQPGPASNWAGGAMGFHSNEGRMQEAWNLRNPNKLTG